jgi:hypothetical protein
MTRPAISQASMPNPTQDLKRTQHDFKNMLEMMLEKKWLCNLFEIIS